MIDLSQFHTLERAIVHWPKVLFILQDEKDINHIIVTFEGDVKLHFYGREGMEIWKEFDGAKDWRES